MYWERVEILTIKKRRPRERVNFILKEIVYSLIDT